MKKTTHEQLTEVFKEHREQLNDWEENFVVDNYARVEKYRDRAMFSPKQAEIIEKIYMKSLEG